LHALALLLNMILGIAIPLGIQLWDRSRLSPTQREWVWGYASWGSALYNFGPLSLVAWGYVTRSPRYWRGLAAGTVYACAAILVQGVLSEAMDRGFGFPRKEIVQDRQAVVVMMIASLILALVVGALRSVYELLGPLAKSAGTFDAASQRASHERP